MVSLRFLRLAGFALLPIALAASCSLANKPGEAIPGATSGPSATSAVTSGPGGSTSSSGGGMPMNTCGNGKLEAGEACDDGQETVKCNLDCSKSACGDGKINRTAGEVCDDGNDKDKDACSVLCQVTPFDLDTSASPGAQDVAVAPDVTVVKAAGVEQFVAVWSHLELNGKGKLPRISRWDSKGKKVGDDIVIGSQSGIAGPRVTTNSTGRSAVVWLASGGSGNEMHYRILEGGDPAKTLEQVVTGAAPALRPQVAAAANGNFCFAWLEGSTPSYALETRCLDPMGGAVGGITTITAAFAGPQQHTFGPLALFPVGDHFMTVYLDTLAPHYMFGKQVGANGKPVSDTQYPLSTPPNGVSNVYIGDGIGEADGSYAVLASVNGLVGPFDTVFVRAFDMLGVGMGGEQPVEGGVHHEHFGSIVRAAGPEYFAVWTESAQSSKDCWVRGRRIGFPTAFDPAIDIMPQTGNKCAMAPRVAVNSAGDVMVVWLVQDLLDVQFPSQIQAAIYPGAMAKK